MAAQDYYGQRVASAKAITQPNASSATKGVYRFKSAAGINNTLVRAGAANLQSIVAWASVAGYLKFYDKATAPVAGTDTPVLVIYVPVGTTTVNFHNGLQFSLGLGLASPSAPADASATGITTAETIGATITYA